MRNPWLELPHTPDYVLSVDRPHVDAFNEHAKDEKHRLNLGMIPVPFTGNRRAPLVVLGLNPSWQTESPRLEAGTGPLAEALRANLGDDPQGQVHVGFNSAPEFKPAWSWWAERCFKDVIEDGLDPDELAHKVLAVDFHGYRSKNARDFPCTIPSQPFGFHLVIEAIKRGATIVVTRGERQWEVAVPQLRGYANRVRLNSVQNARISPGNCGEEGFARVRAALKA